MRSYVVARIVLGLGLCASPALADDKLENPSAPPAAAPSDAPVAAPSAPEPAAPPTQAVPAPVAKTEAKADPFAELPKQCAPIAKRMATPNAVQAMSARIALANCMADARLAPLKLLDTQESMLEVEAAIAPSFELLDDVIARAGAQNQLLAHHAKMRIVQQCATRMLAAVPPAAQPTVEAAQLRDSRRVLVEAMIAPWRAQIADEARAANEIAASNPKLAKIASVALALRETKKAAPDAIATAEGARGPSPASAGRAGNDARPANDIRPANERRAPASPAGTAEETLR